MNDSFGTGAFGTLDAGEKGLEGPSFTVEDLQAMRVVFKAFEEQIDAIDLGPKKAVSKPGLFIVDLLQESRLSKDTAEPFIATLDNVLQVGVKVLKFVNCCRFSINVKETLRKACIIHLERQDSRLL